MSRLKEEGVSFSGRARSGFTALISCLSLGLLIAGCSSSAPTGGEAPPAPPPPVLDYTRIAGEWAGEVTERVLDREITYEAVLELSEGAAEGRNVGTVDYGNCGGNLLALDVDGPNYAVTEQLTYGLDECRNGTVRLRLDTEEIALDYEWYTASGELHATGVLTRLD